MGSFISLFISELLRREMGHYYSESLFFSTKKISVPFMEYTRKSEKKGLFSDFQSSQKSKHYKKFLLNIVINYEVTFYF
ncbi:hypothetical protein D920_00256 [Enterococcus faecalis 13-SD-W-01]|nr:hypothetical protein D920_00256 [Enterococcus faecalis 13-SD-W-01]